MKSFKTILFTCLMLIALSVNAQTAEEIIENYFENTGGKAKWESLKGLKMIGKGNGNGMEIPVERVSMKNGKMYLQIDIQGQKVKQMAFDGENIWGMNFMTQKAEKQDAEANKNYKNIAEKIFPSPFLNYKSKGFSVELLGKETKEGTECFKIKLTMTPILIDGKEEDNSTIYYFDTENFVPIASEQMVSQGPMKGQMLTNTMSDYQEVEGLYFPFSMSLFGAPINFDSIIINPEVTDADFAMPAGASEAATAPKN
jgi:outer membrane lipoprotein-sorting protein